MKLPKGISIPSQSFIMADTTPIGITPRLLGGKRVKMTPGPAYVFERGYGYKGTASHSGTEYEVFGADCGADCACDAVAIPTSSRDMVVIHGLLDAGVIPIR